MSAQAIIAALAAAAAAAYYYAQQSAQAATAGAPAAMPQAPSLLDQLVQGYFTRGLRDNNPGNIREGGGFRGDLGDDGSGYAIFDTMQDGCRALCIVLDAYRTRYGLNTVAGIVARYAPSSENDTDAYVSDVCGRLGVSADQPLDTADATTMAALMRAIIRHENGYNPLSDDVIFAGINAARS